MKSRQCQEAIGEFNKFISSFPASPLVKQAHMNIAQCWYNMGKNEDAVSAFVLVRNKYPKSAEALSATRSIKRIYSELNKDQELFALLGDEIALSEKDTIAFEAAFDLYNKDNCEESSRKFAKYIEDFPKGYYLVRAHYYKADCDYSAKRYDAALSGYEYVLANGSPEFMEVSTRQAATVYYLKKNYEKSFAII
jgi:TolA-binding protein